MCYIKLFSHSLKILVPFFTTIAQLTKAKIRAEMECEHLEQIKEKNLQTANTIQSTFETPKITTIFLGIFSCCCDENIAVPKPFFLSHLKVSWKRL